MAELCFDYRCSNCLIPIPSESGYVLSCGDFFCATCGDSLQEIQRNICPNCGMKDLQVVQLTHPPSEVVGMLTNPAQELQTFFDSLKFQIQHYKVILKRATSLLNKMDIERQQLIKKCSELTGQVERLSRKSYDEPQGDERMIQPKVFWKSGSDKIDHLFPQSQRPQEYQRDDQPRRVSTPLPMPMPSPNKVYSQRPLTPNSPQVVDTQRKRKYPNINNVESPKLTPTSASSNYQNDGNRANTNFKYQKSSSSDSHGPVSSPLPSSSSRLRSPYLPYIRSSGKVSNRPPT